MAKQMVWVSREEALKQCLKKWERFREIREIIDNDDTCADATTHPLWDEDESLCSAVSEICYDYGIKINYELINTPLWREAFKLA